MPKVRRYHCYKLTGMTRANDGTWCVYADADKRYRELEAQVEKYKSEIRESCEDMRSEYRTCDLAHELGEKNKELEAQLARSEEAYELVNKDCQNLTEKVIPNIKAQLATEQADFNQVSASYVAAEKRAETAEAQLDEVSILADEILVESVNSVCEFPMKVIAAKLQAILEKDNEQI